MADLRYCLYYLDRKAGLEPGKTYRLGRGPDNDIRLPGLTVSRRHANITFHAGHFVIQDAKSLNGLAVNGRRVDRHTLFDGDHIVIGTCYLVYREFDPADEARVELERELSDTLCIEHQMAELLQSIGDKPARSKLFSLKRSVDRARAKLDRLANRDRLTGLYNRRSFEEELEKEVERARRYGHPLSLFMIDLDNFKNVNDEHGHRRGDKVLAAAAAVITENTRLNDLAARYGGEEIAVILPQLEPDQAVAAAEKIRGLVERQSFERAGLTVTASVGVAMFASGDTPGELVRKADRALYEAKRRGRNRVIVFAPRPAKGDAST